MWLKNFDFIKRFWEVHWLYYWVLWKSEGSLWEAEIPMCFTQVTRRSGFAMACLQLLSLLRLCVLTFKRKHVTQAKCAHWPFYHQTETKKYQIVNIDLLIEVQDWGKKLINFNHINSMCDFWTMKMSYLKFWFKSFPYSKSFTLVSIPSPRVQNPTCQ